MVISHRRVRCIILSEKDSTDGFCKAEHPWVVPRFKPIPRKDALNALSIVISGGVSPFNPLIYKRTKRPFLDGQITQTFVVQIVQVYTAFSVVVCPPRP